MFFITYRRVVGRGGGVGFSENKVLPVKLALCFTGLCQGVIGNFVGLSKVYMGLIDGIKKLVVRIGKSFEIIYRFVINHVFLS